MSYRPRGDPNDEAGYTYKGSFNGEKAEIGGYTPGMIVCGRLRNIAKTRREQSPAPSGEADGT